MYVMYMNILNHSLRTHFELNNKIKKLLNISRLFLNPIATHAKAMTTKSSQFHASLR